MKHYFAIILMLILTIQFSFSQQSIGDGKWLVPPSYDKIRTINEEPALFPVADYYGKWGFIDKTGRAVIPFKFQNAYPFSEGLAAVKVDNKYAYVNLDGVIQIPASYSFAGRFNNERAIVSKDGKNFLINTKGEIISQKYSDMGWFSKKHIACKKGYSYDIINLSGKLIKSKLCTDFFYTSEGLIGVKIYGKWGFIDEDFKIIIKPQFTEKLVYAFHNDLARFKKSGKVGVIDKTGKVVLPAQYENLYEFSDGLAAFQKNGKWGYLNKAGEIIIPAQYYDVRNFKYGMAKVKTDYSTTSLIDKNNNPILKNIRDIHVFSEKLLAVKTSNGWGLFLLN